MATGISSSPIMRRIELPAERRTDEEGLVGLGAVEVLAEAHVEIHLAGRRVDDPQHGELAGAVREKWVVAGFVAAQTRFPDQLPPARDLVGRAGGYPPQVAAPVRRVLRQLETHVVVRDVGEEGPGLGIVFRLERDAPRRLAGAETLVLVASRQH